MSCIDNLVIMFSPLCNRHDLLCKIERNTKHCPTPSYGCRMVKVGVFRRKRRMSHETSCERLTSNTLGFIKERKVYKDCQLLPPAFFELPK